MIYNVLQGGLKSKDNPSLFEAAYEFWYSSWSQFFKEQDPQFNLSPNEFFRQDAIGVLSNNSQIVGVHLYSEFDLSLSVTQNHEYLSHNFTHQYFSKIKELKISNVMTFEGLMISPKFRKSFTGISLAPVLVALSYQYLLFNSHIQAMIAPARSDNGVAQLGKASGCEIIDELVLHGTPVALILGRRENIHLNFLKANEQALVLHLFNNFITKNIIKRRQDENSVRIRIKSA
ncbi:MAG: hypothetical protein ACK5V3_04905 [Bdellovibrionales bacterium]